MNSTPRTASSSWISPSPPSDGGEGRGEEVRRAIFICFRLFTITALFFATVAGAPDRNQSTALPIDLLPDLVMWADPEQNFLYGWYLDRAQVPGRTLLRVSTATPNIGMGPLELIGSSGTPEVYQRIFRSDGSSRDRYAGTFTFDPQHGHVHFDDWLSFNLRAVLPGNGLGAIIVAGEKRNFAIIDLQNYDPLLPGHPAAAYYGGGLVQGLSVGWADVYAASLPEQWIDVTGIASGRYWLEAIVDPANHILELDESNNSARILIDLDLAGLTGAPRNDDFANATLLTNVTAGLVGSNLGATKESSSSEPNHAGNSDGASVWYRWTAPSTMSVTISTDGSDFDTIIAVYTGSELGALSLIASDDDGGLGIASRVTFNSTAGTTYQIAVDGYSGTTGNIQFNFNPAWNDDFSNCLALAGAGGSTSGSTRGATRQTGEPLHAGGEGTNSIWYCWTTPTNGPVTFDTVGSGFDTLLAVYTGSALGALTLVARDDNSGPVNTSRLTFNALSNTTYRIAVDGLGSANGLVRLSWLGPTPPSITRQPLATNLVPGSAMQLSVVTDGSIPMSYRWRHFGTSLVDDGRISGAGSATLTIAKVLSDDAGTYTVLATNLYGAVTSAPANLIVLDSPRVIYVNERRAAIGGTVDVPVEMRAVGDEHAMNFSVVFDPAVLSHPHPAKGAHTASALLSVNNNDAARGRIGVSIVFPIGQGIAAGAARELARVSFEVNPAMTNGAKTFVGFGDLPLSRYLVATNGATLKALFAAGLLALDEAPVVAGGMRLADGRFQVSFRGVPGRRYVIEGTDDLGSPNWWSLSTNQTTLGGILRFIDPQSVASIRRFYRARFLP